MYVHAQTRTHKCMYSQCHQQPSISSSSLMSTCFALECCASGNCPCCQSDLCLLCHVVGLVRFSGLEFRRFAKRARGFGASSHTPPSTCLLQVCMWCVWCVCVCLHVRVACLSVKSSLSQEAHRYNKCELHDTAPIECLDSCSVCYCC